MGVEVVVDADSLSRGAGGAVTGQIFLRHSGGVFPEEGWFDFPVVILTWWIVGLNECDQGKRSSFQGLFMDGPCSFTVTADGHGTLDLSCDGDEPLRPLAGVSPRELLESALVAGRLVSSACRSRAWAGRDVDALRAALAATRGAV